MTDVTAPLTTDRQAPVHPEWPRCDRCGGWSRWRGNYDVRQALRAAGWLVFRRVQLHP